jgi:hypothetical protein
MGPLSSVHMVEVTLLSTIFLAVMPVLALRLIATLLVVDLLPRPGSAQDRRRDDDAAAQRPQRASVRPPPALTPISGGSSADGSFTPTIVRRIAGGRCQV